MLDGNSLLSAAVAGDRAAQQMLLVAHYRALRSHIQQQCQDAPGFSSEVDDVLQETLGNAFKCMSAASFESEAQFHRWLTAIADNKVKDAFRKSKRRPQPTAAKPRIDDDSIIDFWQEIAGSEPTASRVAVRHERIDMILMGLSNLPDQLRAPLELRLQGKNEDEIAAILGRGKGSVRGALHHARKRLAKFLADESTYFRCRLQHSKGAAEDERSE